MKHVRLSITAGGRESEVHPMYDVMANSEFVERAKTSHWNYSGDRLGIMHYVEGEIEPFREAVEGIDAVEEFELTEVDDDSFYAFIMSATDTPTVQQLFDTLTQGQLVVHHPIHWREDGTAVISVVGTSGEIQAAIDGIPDPVSVEVHEIGGLEGVLDAAGELLSDRQREAVNRALELGYYEIPREASVEDVATAMDCGHSTAAEHLRKSEAKLISSLLQETA